ncbi:MAG: 2-hydroxyacyl-CoA dehydratase [Desulfobacteraceae bacterium]|nr:MAG: 2-hydroxyacyl-CoA dehydratase [Desulfobacteraceae bacterium]
MKTEIQNKLQQMVEQNLIDIEEAKEKGKKVIGLYCLYSPAELAVAAGAIPLPLCGTRNDPIQAAEEVLPRNLCPLIKSSYGFAATGTCPYFRFSDFLVADTTCDGKKKMYELLSAFKPLHVLQLPQNQDPSSALPFWLEEVKKCKGFIERQTGVSITDAKLSAAIRLMNQERLAQKALMDLAKIKPSPISGMDLLTILFRTGFFADKAQGIRLIHEIAAEIRNDASQGMHPFSPHAPRILLTGVPVGLGSDKVIKLLEAAGGNVVCFESCSGYKKVFQIDETIDPLQAIAEQYLSTPCSVMSPNQGRLDLLDRLIKEFSVDGVVDLTWQACHTYNVESYNIGKFVQEKHRLPFLHLETDFSEADTETLRVRIEAFLEMVIK